MMSSDSRLIPSPMTEARLKVMQRRAAKGLPLATNDDQPSVTRSVAQRMKARSLRRGNQPNVTRDARFDDEGDAILTPDNFSLIDAFLATPIGSPAAAKALAAWKRDWKR